MICEKCGRWASTEQFHHCPLPDREPGGTSADAELAGRFTEMCARGDCGAAATSRRYGMARCDDHKIDASPCVWERNTDEDGFCLLDHVRYGRHYGETCSNPRPEEQHP